MQYAHLFGGPAVEVRSDSAAVRSRFHAGQSPDRRNRSVSGMTVWVSSEESVVRLPVTGTTVKLVVVMASDASRANPRRFDRFADHFEVYDTVAELGISRVAN